MALLDTFQSKFEGQTVVYQIGAPFGAPPCQDQKYQTGSEVPGSFPNALAYYIALLITSNLSQWWQVQISQSVVTGQFHFNLVYYLLQRLQPILVNHVRVRHSNKWSYSQILKLVKDKQTLQLIFSLPSVMKKVFCEI